MNAVLTILVVSFNTRELTLSCLRSLVSNTTVPCRIIVIDNGSSDGSAQAIEAEFSTVAVVQSGSNVGFARANNIGSEYADGDLLLLLNSDTVVLDRAIDRLLSFANECPEAGIWGGRTVYPSGSLNPSSCWARMTVWSLVCHALGLAAAFKDSSLFNPEGYGGWRRDTVREVDIVSGCFLLIRRRLWRALGGFDPTFFMYGEDADLCLRARGVGARPMFTPAATIVHLGGGSERCAADTILRLWTAKATLVNRYFGLRTQRRGRMLLSASAAIRAGSYALRACLGGGVACRQKASAWREVWRRRREWAQGYCPVPQQNEGMPGSVLKVVEE